MAEGYHGGLYINKVITVVRYMNNLRTKLGEIEMFEKQASRLEPENWEDHDTTVWLNP